MIDTIILTLKFLICIVVVSVNYRIFGWLVNILFNFVKNIFQTGNS